MTDPDTSEWPDPADKAHAVEQANRLRNQVAKGGLRFEGAPWESLQYYPLRDFWCDGKQMISA